MLTIDDSALAINQEKNQPLSIDPVREFSGCCISVTESPGVHFGLPKIDADKYAPHSVQGVTVYVPDSFPMEGNYVIKLRRLFGFKQLFIDGWKLC